MAKLLANRVTKTLLSSGLVLILIAPRVSLSQDSQQSNITTNSQAQAWGDDKSVVLPALEIVGFDFLLNRYNRRYQDRSTYDTSFSSIKHNLHSNWVVDQDRFKINQLFHPYQGSMYFGFARSAGLGFWKSSAYTFAGSALWEIAGETTLPSRNDQLASGVGGDFLGEPLFRMANLLLERGGDSGSRFRRRIGATVISPPTGFNRTFFGDRFDEVYPSHDPIHYSRLLLGTATTTQNVPDPSTGVKRNEGLADFSMDYGIPGKDGYSYGRPFDYFNFQVIASSANGAESVMTRGLLFGTNYEAGQNYRGVWGLYGNYDYLAPQLFRVSSTALSVGTTADWRLSSAVELQGTGLVGTGYAAVGSVLGTNDSDNHYGVAPQALLSLRLILGNRTSLDLGAHEYFVSSLGGAGRGGRDNIARADASFTVRVYRRNGLTIKYLLTRRDASFPDLGSRTQTRGTIGLFYTLLGHERFGTVDWRNRGPGIR